MAAVDRRPPSEAGTSAAGPAVVAAPSGGYRLEFDPALAEEAVLLAIEGAPPEERRRFRGERDRLYEIEEPELREGRFRQLHRRWFARLGLADPLLQALTEEPSVPRSTRHCTVVPAARAKEQYADLYRERRGNGTRASGPPALVLRLTAATLIDRERLPALLRRELLFVADMLDPAFGYQRELPIPEGGAALDNLLRQRYRVLWETSVEGRLVARGHLPEEHREGAQRRFLAAFPMLGKGAEAAFRRIFDGARPTHRELLAFAADPARAADAEGLAAGRCPLCEMPSTAFHASPKDLEAAVLAAIQRDFPTWRPQAGLCLRCADLYAARAAP